MEKALNKHQSPITITVKSVAACMLLIIFTSLTVFSQSASSRQVAKPKGTTECKYGYYEYLPSNYASEIKLPVVIFLHGSGEAGNGTTDLSKVLKNGPPMLVQNTNKDFPFILISPQRTDPWWQPNDTEMMLAYIKKTYKVDTDRIYITGLSAGGYGSYVFGESSSNELAAIVPVCGCGTVKYATNLKNLAIWAFHNDGDPTVKISCANTTINAIKAIGGSPKFTVYNSASHDAWTATYNDQNMWDWLLAQRRSPLQVNYLPRVDASYDAVVTLPTNTFKRKGYGNDKDGTITAYLWTQKSGPTATLPNFNTNEFTASNLIVGNYEFRLTVTDNIGQTMYDDIFVVVKPNQVPIVNAGVDATITLPVNTVTLSASAIDNDGTLIAYLWKQQSGPTATLTNAISKICTASNLTAGTYVFRFHARDNALDVSYDEVSVVVKSAVTQVASVNAGGETLRMDAIQLIEPEEVTNTSSSLVIFPNPLNETNILSLEYNDLQTGTINYTISDQMGVIQTKNSQRLHSPTRSITLDLSAVNLKTGIYMIKISNGPKEVKVFKLFKKN